MKLKKVFIAAIASLAMLCSSCSFSREAATNQNVSQTEVVLAKKNYKIVGQVEGVSTQNYFFGIGGMSKKSLRESAMSDMYKNAGLTGSQAIINVNVAYKTKLVLIHAQCKAIATGTVIEFTD